MFLDFARRKYDPKLVPKLNQACRASTYKDSLFSDLTGKSLDDLWAEFIATLPES